MKEQKKRGRQPRRPFCWLWAPHGKKTIKTTGEWGSTSSAPRPARQDHSSTQGKKCQAIFCRSTLRQATLAHLFAGAVKAGAPEAFTAPAKMEGGKAAGRNAPRGAQPTAGGRSPAISPALPGSPQRGRQGRGGKQGRTHKAAQQHQEKDKKKPKGGAKRKTRRPAGRRSAPRRGACPSTRGRGGSSGRRAHREQGRQARKPKGRLACPAIMRAAPSQAATAGLNASGSWRLGLGRWGAARAGAGGRGPHPARRPGCGKKPAGKWRSGARPNRPGPRPAAEHTDGVWAGPNGGWGLGRLAAVCDRGARQQGAKAKLGPSHRFPLGDGCPRIRGGRRGAAAPQACQGRTSRRLSEPAASDIAHYLLLDIRTLFHHNAIWRYVRQ